MAQTPQPLVDSPAGVKLHIQVVEPAKMATYNEQSTRSQQVGQLGDSALKFAVIDDMKHYADSIDDIKLPAAIEFGGWTIVYRDPGYTGIPQIERGCGIG